MPDDDPTPTRYGEGGCLAMARRGRGQWAPCAGEPVAAGWLDVAEWAPPERRGRYEAYACAAHRGLVQEPRPLEERDVQQMAWRRDQAELALAGRPYELVQPVRGTGPRRPGLRRQ